MPGVNIVDTRHPFRKSKMMLEGATRSGQILIAITFGALLSIAGTIDTRSEASANTNPSTECPVEPRSVAEIETIIAHATPTSGEVVPPTSTDILPEGGSPDRETADGVITAVLILHKCIGAPGQFYALVTDAFMQRQVDYESPASILSEAEATAPAVDVNADRYIAAIGHVQDLGHGRASAIVTLGGIDDPHPAPGRTFLMVFEHVDGRWLLDGMYDQIWNPASMVEPIWIADLFPPAVPPLESP